MKTQRFVTLPGQEPVWNMAPGRTAALKLQNEQTGQSVMAFEEVTPAGTETPLHLPRDSDEVMYVLSGQYSFKVGDKLSSGGPGTCVFMPRDIPHAWKNTGSEPARALFLYTPAAAGGYIEELTEGRPTTDAERNELCERYRWEILGANPL
jgi:quercetin dioxygenase-like cupin family protein